MRRVISCYNKEKLSVSKNRNHDFCFVFFVFGNSVRRGSHKRNILKSTTRSSFDNIDVESFAVFQS